MGGRDSQFDRENYHLLLLARNMTGYRNLLKIATHAQLAATTTSRASITNFLAAMPKASSAPPAASAPKCRSLLLQGKEKEAYERLGWYVDVFGKENFFVELQEHSIPKN
jgi:DNA polymerase-3 subunit alpha